MPLGFPVDPSPVKKKRAYKKRKVDDESDGLENRPKRRNNVSKNQLAFCSRCSRKFIQEDEGTCPACRSILPKSIQRRKKVTGSSLDSKIPSLKMLCIQLVVRYIQDVESFGDISEEIRLTISKILSSSRALDLESLQLFLGDYQDRLDLFDCTRLTSEGFSKISQDCPHLRVLNLGFCGRLTDTDLNNLAISCTLLNEIRLEGPFLCTDDGFSSLFESLNLKKFEIAKARKLSGKSLESLANCCPELESLLISDCESLVDGFTHLGRLRHLTRLGLNQTGMMSSEELMSLLTAKSKDLESLSLNGQSALSDAILGAYSDQFRVLTSLSLENCLSLTNDGLLQFFESMKCPLKSLNLNRIVHVQDTLILKLAGTQTSLERLEMNSLNAVGEAALLSLGTHCVNLVTLDVSWIRGVDDGVLSCFLSHCKSLSTVYIYGCNRISRETLKELYTNKQGETVGIKGNEFD